MTREPEMRWSRLLPPARAWVPIQETPAALVLYELLVAEGQRRITEAFGIPPELLNRRESSNRASIEGMCWSLGLR